MKRIGRVSRRRQALAIAGVLSVGFASTIGMTGTAHADPALGDAPTTTAGTITIHKGEQQNPNSSSGNASGTTAPSNFTPLGGVVFTAYPISNIDLTTNAGWGTLSGITADTVNDAACTAAEAGTSTTVGSTTLTFDSANKIVSAATAVSDGSTTIPAGPAKAYLVCETANSGATDSTGPVHVVAKAQPFIVSVPFPDNDGTGKWLTDVNVYPKNGTATISKTVVDQPDDQVVLGSTAQFPVTTTVPNLPANSIFSYYIVQDPLDSSAFDNVGVASVTLTGPAGANVPLTLGTDDYVVTTSGTTVDVGFTSSGLAKLAQNGGGNVVTTFQGRVISVGAHNNTATLYTDTQTGTIPPTTPPTTPPTNPPTNPPTTPPVSTDWGQLVISKVDSANGDVLSGAEFQVFNATTGTRYPGGTDCSGAVATGSALSDVPTDSTGRVTIPGLFVSDSTNHAGVAARCYVVTETKAPTGYVLPSDASQGVAVSPGEVTGYSVQFSDTKEVVPGLPLTGGQGTLLASVLGALLVAGGAGGAVAARRRKQNA